MPDDPMQDDILDRMVAGTPAPGECRQIVVEILRWPNGPVAAGLRAALRRFGRGDDPDGYDPSLEALLPQSPAVVAALRDEHLLVTSLWAVLQDTPRSRRREAIVREERFHQPALAMRFLDLAEHRDTDGPQALAASQLAADIVDRLSGAAFHQALIEDLRARALGAAADALRRLGELTEAESSLRRAWKALARGSGDALQPAGLARIEASVNLAAGDVAGCVRLLEEVVASYRRLGASQEEGRTLVQLARTVGYDDPARGGKLAGRAAELLQRGAEPPSELAARHLLAWFLADSGDGEGALDEVSRARSLYKTCRGTEAQRLRPWLEARICRRLGALEGAERGFAAVWHEFHRTGYPVDLTLVTLDLAETFLVQGKSRPARRLLDAFRSTLGHLGMHAEGLAAWSALCQAVSLDGVRARQIAPALWLYFRRAWRSGGIFHLPADDPKPATLL